MWVSFKWKKSGLVVDRNFKFLFTTHLSNIYMYLGLAILFTAQYLSAWKTYITVQINLYKKHIGYPWMTIWQVCKTYQTAVDVKHRIYAVCIIRNIFAEYQSTFWKFPDSKVDGANLGPTWGRQDPDGPLVSYMNLAIWVVIQYVE